MIDYSDKIIEKAIEAAISKWGKGSIVSFDPDDVEECPAISTGALSLDIALGIGGIPEGLFTLLLGNPSSGKTSVLLSICAQAQRKYPKKSVAIIDTEHALDLFYASNLGVDLNSIVIVQPESGEEAYDICSTLMRTGRFSVIGIDSLASIQTKEDIEAGADKNPSIANAARLNGRELKRLKTIANQTGTAVVITNQFRTGFASMFSYKTHPGGIAQDYYAAVMIELEAEEKPKAAEDAPTSLSVIAKINKNKVAPPYQIAKFDIEFGKGIIEESCTFATAVKAKVIEKAGAWYKYDGSSYHGKPEMIEAMKNDSSLHNKVKTETAANRAKVLEVLNETKEEIPLNVDIDTGEIFEELEDDEEMFSGLLEQEV